MFRHRSFSTIALVPSTFPVRGGETLKITNADSVAH